MEKGVDDRKTNESYKSLRNASERNGILDKYRKRNVKESYRIFKTATA